MKGDVVEADGGEGAGEEVELEVGGSGVEGGGSEGEVEAGEVAEGGDGGGADGGGNEARRGTLRICCPLTVTTSVPAVVRKS